jgi:lipopolysaccharide heptosyltransferase II
LPQSSTIPEFSKILVRATNWVGDAVMSIPALHAIRSRFPNAHIAILARPWVADLYAREPFADRVIPLTTDRGARDLSGKWRVAQSLRREGFDCAILLQNAFEAALITWLAGIPRRIGYDRDGRGLLLTDRIRPPVLGEIPRHERFYYLELLKRAGIIEGEVADSGIRLSQAEDLRIRGTEHLAQAGFAGPIIGVSPGAAFGGAKRWHADRFASAAVRIATELGAGVAVFGSTDERRLCEEVTRLVKAQGITTYNFAGQTTLGAFIETVAACSLYLTNDSGAMHVACALEVPTVAVFGPTDETATGPTGPFAVVVREKVECSPCLLRECPIDHRCMSRVSIDRVVETALDLKHQSSMTGSHGTRIE